MNTPTAQDVTHQLRAAWKFSLSFLKREWTVDDYPIFFRFQQGVQNALSSRLVHYPWSATVVNWPIMSGFGNTKREALEALRKSFEQRKSNEQKLPRPGTGLPIEFASRSRVERHSDLAEHFTNHVLDKDWAWLSDASSLWDFHHDETNDALNNKVQEVYGIDVSDIASGNLADIFDRISEKTRR